MVKDIAPGEVSSTPDGSEIAALDNLALFLFASSQAPPELVAEIWISDGSTAGTARVKEIPPAPGPVRLLNLQTRDGSGYFLAEPVDGSSIANQLWKTNGTEAGTVLIFSVANASVKK